MPSKTNLKSLERRLKSASIKCGLTLGKQGRLRTLPGSAHWHITGPDSTGTLELTFLENADECWFAVHANREADWIDEVLPKLIGELEGH